MDPLNGQSLSKEELQERLAPLFADTGLMRDGATISDDLLAHYLRAATPREIVARMLRNLEEVYRSEHDAERLTLVQRRLLVLLPVAEDDAPADTGEDEDD